ncbi:hypothetical protein AXF42_Ash001355 [Apostasia shenzhenica]|uniref:RING-type domain-containing protein n=1 Tax=Apostasia shenzhenica TaxID=1088818 RepID=A0A2I0AUN6_9ASPA|nr:hypothetical protein AXF42_Ash001355 [Apostasia shenzhenica]
MAVHAFSPVLRAIRAPPAGDLIEAAAATGGIGEQAEQKKRPHAMLLPAGDFDGESELANGASVKRRRSTVNGNYNLFHAQSAEVETLVQIHQQQLRAGVAEILRRHGQALAAAAESWIREKDEQLDRLCRVNSALQQNLITVFSQNQQLIAAARRSEAVAAALRGHLEHIISRNDAAAGDQESCADNDAQSCCRGAGEEEWRFRCRVCGEREAAVVLLPCRHLCVCQFCEAVAGECPCCRQAKSAAVQGIQVDLNFG